MMKLLSGARDLKRLRLEGHGPKWLAYTNRRMKDSCRGFGEHVVTCGIAKGKINSSSLKVDENADHIIFIEEWRVEELSPGC